MTTPDPARITQQELKTLFQRAGLDLTDAELERLLPMYRTTLGQLAMLHDPSLPLAEPAATFRPDWTD